MWIADFGGFQGVGLGYTSKTLIRSLVSLYRSQGRDDDDDDAVPTLCQLFAGFIF